MLFKLYLFFVATTLFTHSIAIPVPSSSEPEDVSLSRREPGFLAIARRLKAALPSLPSKAAMQHAQNRMQNTIGIPKRKDQFQAGGAMIPGKQVRTAVMHSYLHGMGTVGPAHNRYPKVFMNFPYRYHKDASLNGKKPITSNTKGTMREYPIWPDRKRIQPGVNRVITSSQGRRDKFEGVTYHDKNRGGGRNDVYLAKHIKAQKTAGKKK